jgi:putative oxidoreductase
MTGHPTLYDRTTTELDRLGNSLVPLMARACFAAVLLMYFWVSGLTKLDGVFTPSLGAYAQIFPRAMEAAGYDASQMGALRWLIVLGLATRLAALGMIGFVVVQSLTDIIGHAASPATIGAWFDAASDALILDQRALWVFVLLTLVLKGAGPMSIDRVLALWRTGDRED